MQNKLILSKGSILTFVPDEDITVFELAKMPPLLSGDGCGENYHRLLALPQSCLRHIRSSNLKLSEVEIEIQKEKPRTPMSRIFGRL